MTTQRLRPKGCKCHPDSPFLWYLHTGATIADKHMRVQGTDGMDKSQRATVSVAKQKKDGKYIGMISGISRDKEAEMLRLRDFMTYSRAKRSDVSGVEVMENGDVAA